MTAIDRARVMGIDPAVSKPIWWALSGVWHTGSVEPTDPRTMVYQMGIRRNVGLVLIEGGFVGRGKERDSLALAECRGDMRTCARLAKLSWTNVAPSTWMNAMLVQRGARLGDIDIPEVSKLVASDITGRAITNEDEAAAVCMAEWGECHFEECMDAVKAREGKSNDG